MRVQSTHSLQARGADAYWTPHCAVESLVVLEAEFMPRRIWEPAAGVGSIADVLRQKDFYVYASDLFDYGVSGISTPYDYLITKTPPDIAGIVTNPPFRLALPFVQKALSDVTYSAFLLRTNFLESVSRLALFRKHPPARIWVSSRRLPMMHRKDWRGPRTSSNTCYAWFVWDQTDRKTPRLDWFDWRDFSGRSLYHRPVIQNVKILSDVLA